MAKEREYKEGVDFEWVEAKGTGGTARTRNFFTKAEKKARAAAAEAKPAANPRRSETRTASPRRAEPKKEAPKPKANPARKPGGARPEGKVSGLPAARGRAAEANPAVVGAMAAGAVGAGIAAARSGRGAKVTGGGNAATGRLAPPPARLALPAPTRGGTVIPPANKPKALPAPKPAAKPKPSAKPRAGAGRAVGANPGRRLGGGNKNTIKLPDILDLKNM